jgi:hypothetical protein
MYVVPGALTTVSIDCEKDEGVYVEQGVWMKHDASDKRLVINERLLINTKGDDQSPVSSGGRNDYGIDG